MEEWRKIDGFETYSVSNHGNVRNDVTGRILKQGLNKGYNMIALRKNEKNHIIPIHRLVAIAFCEKYDDCNEVDHIDQHKENNYYLNLRWVTHSNNLRNRKKREGCSSRYQGVSFVNFYKKWVARIMINGKNKHLGSYNTPEEARDAFRKAVTEHNLQDFYPPDADEQDQT